MDYEDLVILQNWLQSCHEFPPDLGDAKAKVPIRIAKGPQTPDVTEADIDRILKKAGFVRPDQIGGDGKIQLSRPEKCLLGLQKAAKWPCGSECPAPWWDSRAPFLFQAKVPSVQSLMRKCNFENYQKIIDKKFPSKAKWDAQQAHLRQTQLNKLSSLKTTELKHEYDVKVAALEKQRVWTAAQKRAKEEAKSKALKAFGSALGEVDAKIKTYKERAYPSYDVAKKAFWERGCQQVPQQYQHLVKKAQMGFEQCMEQVREGQLSPDYFARKEAEVRRKLHLQRQQLKEVKQRKLTAEEEQLFPQALKANKKSLDAIKGKRLSTAKRKIIEDTFLGTKRQLDRQQVVKEHCIVKRPGNNCLPGESYKTLEPWTSLRDVEQLANVFTEKCPETIAASLRGEV
jgi:hypothetical protein